MPNPNTLTRTLSLAAIATLAAILLLGCGTTDKHIENNTDTDTDLKTEDTSPNTIDIHARPWNPTASCWNPPQLAGTYDKSPGCDTALAVTKDTDGNYWLFTDLCIPDGYTTENDQIALDMQATEPCTEKETQARQWNPTDTCWGPSQDAGTYIGPFTNCPEAEALTKDADGNYWLFPNLCVPTEYTNADDQEVPEMQSTTLCDQ